MRIFRARLIGMAIGAAMLAALTAGGTVSAQQAIPGTAPELKDFRLDPQRPAPKPEPTTPQPVVIPPPAVSTLPEKQTARPAPVQSARPQSTRPQSTQPQPTSSRPAQQLQQAKPQPETFTGVSSPETTNPPVAVSPQVEANPPESDAAPISAPDTPAAAIAFWQIAAALGSGALLLWGAYWFLKRRKPVRAAREHQTEPANERALADAVVPAEAPIPTKPMVPAEASIPVAASLPAKTIKAPRITLEFIPEKATVSVVSLTIKGQLRLINEGDALAKDMTLRAGLISASADQGSAINAFNADPDLVPAETLGEAKPGERIGMTIEMSVPLSEMQSFAVGDQRLFVPIMVANLTYRGSTKASTATVHIACMIGREANPPVAKMGPLRLDLGPRSFAPLGTRSLYA